jgi:transcription initiation factor TFIID subunit 9B
MAARTKQTQPVLPRDAHLIMSLLQTMGISDWEPRVVNQLLEFTHSECCRKITS